MATIETELVSPFPFIRVSLLGGFFATYGWLYGSTGSLVGVVPSQTSAAWVNTIISVV